MDNTVVEPSVSGGSGGNPYATSTANISTSNVDSPPEGVTSPRHLPHADDRYTIGDVVSTLTEEFPSLSVSKVRYLERRGLLTLERTEGGYRLFAKEDVDLLRTILALQENEYLPLEIIKQRIDSGIIHTGSQVSNGVVGDVSPLGGHGLDEKAPGNSVSYTKEDLCKELEAEPRLIDELISVGVIGNGARLGSGDFEIARIAVEMSGYGIQPRHLRGIVASVEREVAMFKQVLNPDLRSGDDQRISRAMENARYLASVDTRLKELIMSGAVESFDPR